MTNFWVIMQKRRDGKVYTDLHKTNQKIYLEYEDALEDFYYDAHFKENYHIVKMIATLDEVEPNEVLLNTLIEFE